ncbi:hypothetical protein NL108_014972 [Boleophthalmus pectinirostris]|uniref:uncharacterized protein LOC129412378 n=1 Tax=Boleophthalmus pectinirostris TaxID=150288 RepID=UPI00242E4854|nr:uncharacterized protein LOC129412378 [Boleophthalmus pectinirostris]KAJ0062520.1 hypothetical protein NL108_014972 [Boleophthalmus pectinirostris]
MAQFRPALLTLLLTFLLTLHLHCTDSAPPEFVKKGGSITLPCKNVGQNKNNGNIQKCNGTMWIFNSTEKQQKSEVLIEHGKITSKVPEMKPRLRVTQECGLEIQNVRPQDAGKFQCQFNQSGRHLPPDASVYLSVVSLITSKYMEKNIQFKCNVSSSLSAVKTKWLLNGKDINNKNITTHQTGTTVKVPFNSLSSYKNQLECEVTHGLKKMKSFTLAELLTTTVTTQNKKEEEDANKSSLWAILVAGVLLIVGGIIWKKHKGQSE